MQPAAWEHILRKKGKGKKHVQKLKLLCPFENAQPGSRAEDCEPQKSKAGEMLAFYTS